MGTTAVRNLYGMPPCTEKSSFSLVFPYQTLHPSGPKPEQEKTESGKLIKAKRGRQLFFAKITRQGVAETTYQKRT